ncbi:MAG: aminoacyl-tRNA hydrolase [Pirellulales bacterium]
MKLVVGLGNPGRKYIGTRHNIGFVVLDELSRRHATASARKAYGGEVVEANVGGERLLLLAPHTYMNRSGQSVRQAVDFYKIEPADVLVVCDDMNLPLGQLRMRIKGSDGGQKGLADIIRHLGTDELSRLRVGIDRPPENWDGVDYVLGKFTKAENEEMAIAVPRAADAVAVWAAEGAEACMNRFNSKKN